MKNYLKIIIITISLSAGLLFSSQSVAKPVIFDSDSHSQKEVFLDNDAFHSEAVHQQEQHSVYSGRQGDHFYPVKWIDSVTITILATQTKLSRKSNISQDLNRCENVSLLLFPFHIFW